MGKGNGKTARRRTAATLALAAALAAIAAAPSQAAAPPPTLPAPTYKSVSREVLVKMDDGVQLAGTVALPSLDGSKPLPGRFPVVVGMTPYGRNGVCGCYTPDFWATRGMAGAVFDVRGTGGSEGNLDQNFFSPREARDSAEVIEYLGTRPYSTGKVGMAGGSYVGITQFLAAEQQPPHLKAIAPQVPISDLYREGYTHGGIPNLLFDAQYIAVQGAPGEAGTNTDPYLLQETLAAKLGQSPPGTIAFDYLARPNDDAWYHDRSPITHADRIRVPTLIAGGWRDGISPRGAPEMYRVLARRRNVETRLYMDPCTHKGCGAPFAPLTNPPNQEDVSALVFEFLSKHLLGTKTPKRAPVHYYLQGRNRFFDASRWPPKDTRLDSLALGPGSLGGTSSGAPAQGSYVTNPAAGFSMAFNKYGTVAASPYIPTDQRLEGENGLTFRTPVLDKPLDLVGPSALHLVASSTASDTDWYVKLADVAPDGSESIIEEGALRASQRALDPEKSTPARPYHTHVNPTPIEPGRFYDYDIEIWPTAYEVAPGHQLQLRLTSMDLPTHLPGSIRFDRSDPAATQIELNSPAVNTVRYAGSHLTLSVDPKP
jgi:putative CocE/NonD family hydrolase